MCEMFLFFSKALQSTFNAAVPRSRVRRSPFYTTRIKIRSRTQQGGGRDIDRRPRALISSSSPVTQLPESAEARTSVHGETYRNAHVHAYIASSYENGRPRAKKGEGEERRKRDARFIDTLRALRFKETGVYS